MQVAPAFSRGRGGAGATVLSFASRGGWLSCPRASVSQSVFVSLGMKAPDSSSELQTLQIIFLEKSTSAILGLKPS